MIARAWVGAEQRESNADTLPIAAPRTGARDARGAIHPRLALLVAVVLVLAIFLLGRSLSAL